MKERDKEMYAKRHTPRKLLLAESLLVCVRFVSRSEQSILTFTQSYSILQSKTSHNRFLLHPFQFIIH